ncbi:hypothetical protein DYB30_009640 [Aphanomyces astaci]|uniref:Uncharacterized protein n=1 Tax=Aphanomyces astaci TaxID=112090 RepID=A0A397CYE4_APHAT|nr:hypothetical protein DYB30_009640 [Aphanomyces astaci]
MGNEARQEVLNSGLVEDVVRGRTTDLDSQLAVTRVAHKELEAIVLERSGMAEKLRVEREDLQDETKALDDEISRIRSSEKVAVSAAPSRMERQRLVDAAMVSALRAELGLSRARVEDDKGLEQASLAQKDRTIGLLERADAEKQTAALEIEEERRRLNAVVDARDLQLRILEGEAHESNVNLNMLTDMNGELQSDLKKRVEPSDLLSREELRSERNVLEGTAAELVSAQAALAQERVRLDEAKWGFAAKVTDERALFDEERRSWLTQLSNDRSQVDLERRSRLLSERLELFACRQQPRINPTSSLPWGVKRRIPFNNLTTCMTRRYKYGEPLMEPALASTTGTHAPHRPEPYRSTRAPTSGLSDGGDGNDPRRFGEDAYGSGGLSGGGGGPGGNGGDGGGDPAPYPRFGADPYSRRPADRHSLVGNARKQSMKLESVDKLQLDHFLGHLDDLQIEFKLTDIELIRIFEYRVAESKIRTVQDWWARRHREGSNRTWRRTRSAFCKEFVQKSMSAKMAEITQNSLRKVKETVREYAWRINDAAQDLELRHSQAVQIFIDGCKDPGVASCIRGSETRPGTIQECLDYLRFRHMDLDMRLNDANGHDVPRSTSSATLVNRSNSTDATSKSTEVDMAALRADVASMMQNQLASLTNVVANIAPRRPSGNQPVVPNIRMDPDDTTTQSGRVVCGRCQRSGHGREACPHEVDTEDDVAGSPVEEGYSHDGSMRTLGRVGYALEVEVGFPTEVIRGEPAVEQAPLESHDQYEKSVVDSVASSEARAVRVDLPVQGAASTAGGYTDLPHSTAVESQVTGPEKLTLPSVNDPSVRWVFTPHQIEAIVRCDFPGIVEGLHSDMEDRMLPLTKADVADQVRKIRDRRKSPTHREIAEVIMQVIQRKLTDEDMRLLETPADMDDPARWLRWFASALETIGDPPLAPAV